LPAPEAQVYKGADLALRRNLPDGPIAGVYNVQIVVFVNRQAYGAIEGDVLTRAISVAGHTLARYGNYSALRGDFAQRMITGL
jgi:hypothetical protein